LAEAILAATTLDLSQQVERGLRLAESMSARWLLPQFERLLIGLPEPAGPMDAAAEERD